MSASSPHSGPETMNAPQRLGEWLELERTGSREMLQYDPRPDIESLLEQFETASDLLRRLREWDIIAGPGTPEGEFTADAPYWRSELDRVLSIPASEPEQEAK